MKISNIINILFVLLMGFIFAPAIMRFLDTNKILGIPFNLIREIFVLLLLHGFLFAYRPKVFIGKSMLFVYLYLLIFFLFKISGYYDTSNIWFGAYNLSIYISVLTYTYYITRKDYKGLSVVVVGALVFITLSSLLNIYQIVQHPLLARTTGGGEELHSKHTSMGILNYSFVQAVAILFPVLIWLYKKVQIKRRKVFIIISIIIILLSIYVSAVTAAILISMCGIILALFGRRKLKISLFLITIFMVIFIITPRLYISQLFYSISEITGNRDVSRKFDDVGLAIQYGVVTRDPTTSIEYRAGRAPLNIEQFLKYPIFGKGVEGNAHIFWLNFLAQFGLVGTFSLILILFFQFKKNMSFFLEDFKFYYLLSFFLFILMGFLKTYGKNQTFEVAIFVLPGIYYLKYLVVQPNLDYSRNKIR